MFRVSPGVDIKEKDVTLIVPALSTSIGGIAGDFEWGPVLFPNTVSNEEQLVSDHGKPTEENFDFWYSAVSFLWYSNNLKVVRTDQNGATNAVAGATSSPNTLKIRNRDEYDILSFSASDGYFAAKYPGAVGNSISISFCLADRDSYNNWVSADGVQYFRFFDGAPGTSFFCQDKGVYNDEMHIVVVDEGGEVTGTPGTILERFGFASLAKDARYQEGYSSYFVNVLNDQSNYVYWLNNNDDLSLFNAGQSTDWIKQNTSMVGGKYVYFDESLDTSPSPRVYSYSYSFQDGASGERSGLSQLQTAYDVFKDANIVDINLLIGGSTPPGDNDIDAYAYCAYLIDLAYNRHDTMVFLSPPIDGDLSSVFYNTTSQPINFIENVVNFVDYLPSTSFAAIDSCAIKVYDRYNSVYRWIPANGSVAGLCARTDDTDFPWFSPAGLNRGIMSNVARISYNPIEAERDELYKARINPIVQFAGEGTLLFGDKTLLARPSAFDRINVRRLFNVLEKSIATAAKFMLFEINDEFTRARFISLVEPYLRQVQANRGIYDFRVVCDETNNTPEIIDSNQFVGDIYIKPTRSINFITLNFISVGSGVEFEEIIGEV